MPDFTLDFRDSVRSERVPLLQVEPFNRFAKTDHANLLQIFVRLFACFQQAVGDISDKAKVSEYNPVSKSAGRLAAIGREEFSVIHGDSR